MCTHMVPLLMSAVSHIHSGHTNNIKANLPYELYQQNEYTVIKEYNRNLTNRIKPR